jgi:hypothetical protein
MRKYRLNKSIRFREESGYILICDCKRLLDYEIPKEYFSLLKCLEKDYAPKPEEEEIVSELLDIGIVVVNGKERKEYKKDIFSKLGYDENEFI